MDRSEYRRIEEEIDRKGQTDEATAGRLLAVAQGKDTAGDVAAPEAEDVLVRAFLGKALAVIDKFSAAQPFGVGFDEAKCLDKAVGAIRKAVQGYDPARGTFDDWCRVVVWRAVNKNVKRATAGAPVFVSLEGMREQELGGCEAGGARDEAIADAKAEADLARVEARVVIDDWAKKPTGALAHRLPPRRRGRDGRRDRRV